MHPERRIALHEIALTGLVVVFKFFMDDSERGGVLAMGGYLAHMDHWSVF